MTQKHSNPNPPSWFDDKKVVGVAFIKYDIFPFIVSREIYQKDGDKLRFNAAEYYHIDSVLLYTSSEIADKIENALNQLKADYRKALDDLDEDFNNRLKNLTEYIDNPLTTSVKRLMGKLNK